MKGFTLIEILVVIGIIGIMTGMAIPYYNNFTADKNLTIEAQKMADVLNLARKKAIVGDIGNNSTCGLEGYQVEMTTSSYSLEQCCNGAACSSSIIQSYAIPSSTSVSMTTAPGSGVKFSVLSGTAQAALTVKMKSTIRKCVDVSVTTTGTIDVGNTYTAGC